MKKILVCNAIILILIILPIAGASNFIATDDKEQIQSNNLKEDSTHTVLVEFGTMTTCPYCVTAGEQLYSIYNSGDFDFHYVSLVWDVGNRNVRDRLKELKVGSVPDVFFDGKYQHILGAKTDEQPYRNAINQSGMRVVPDIDIDVDVSWMGLGTLKIIINVINNEPETYNGHIRTYIIEKVSRWNDYSGNPYHYAALDIPIDRNLAVAGINEPKKLGENYTFTKTWYGGLQGFFDIKKDNIKVVASVFDIDTDYIVETASAVPTATLHNNWPSAFLLFEKIINNFPTIQLITHRLVI